MITKKEVRVFILKMECAQYSKLGGYYLSKSVDSALKRNFGDSERYQELAEKYYLKLGVMVDKLMEVAR